MRTSARHMRLASVLFLGVLFVGCESAVTGPDLEGNREDVAAADAGSDAREAPPAEFCVRREGQWVCPSEDEPGLPK